MINSLFGTKLNMVQVFDTNGKRLVATRIKVAPHSVTQTKSEEKDGYMAVQLGFGQSRKVNKPLAGHLKKAGAADNLRRLKEVKTSDGVELTPGTIVKLEQVLQAGDVVTVVGVSKGKGFAGVVKRWNFHGGPKTHGQSDRHRSPGSIGSGTTPGRVVKGKRMAGRMGNDQITVKGLMVLDIDAAQGIVLVSGPVPGANKGLIQITKVGESKKFAGLVNQTTAPAEEIEAVESVEPTTEEATEVAAEEGSDSASDKDTEVSEGENATESTVENPTA